MDNVIHVNFGSPKPADVPVSEISTLSEYLQKLREEGLDEADIIELVDAIEHESSYLVCDEVIKELADAWFDRYM